MVSITQVAEAAGVSPATASRVLSNSSYPVRDETREKVLEAARALDFRPNLLARALATSRTGIVAVIVHDISDPYFAEIVRGVEDAAHAEDFQILVSSSDRNPDRELEVLELMLAYNVDGVMMAGGSLSDERYEHECGRLFATFTEEGRGVVLLGPHQVDAPRVSIDNEEASARMTRHLADLGHRRIGYIDGPRLLSTTHVRANGYRRGLEEAGLDHDPGLVVSGGFTSDGGSAATAALLDRYPDLTAVFASSDLMALGALSQLRHRGLDVPGDVSVAGFDDITAARYTAPPLTTVAVPMRQLGEDGFHILTRILKGDDVEPVTLPTRLMLRDSTAPPTG